MEEVERRRGEMEGVERRGVEGIGGRIEGVAKRRRLEGVERMKGVDRLKEVGRSESIERARRTARVGMVEMVGIVGRIEVVGMVRRTEVVEMNGRTAVAVGAEDEMAVRAVVEQAQVERLRESAVDPNQIVRAELEQNQSPGGVGVREGEESRGKGGELVPAREG